MRALIKKELRENLKLAAFGLAVLALTLGMFYREYNASLRDVLAGTSAAFDGMLQPLTRGESHGWIAFLCGAFGVLLGWFQIHNEGSRDLWAFLLHRPLSRSQLFLGKVVAGLSLYVVTTGVPLVCFLAWACTPGHVAAPFEWGMVLSIVALWLGGMGFYFAGMLTALRQARWYGSRALGLITALLVVISTPILPSFGHGLLLLLAGIAVLGTAAWGAFLSSGFYEGQPAQAKSALTVSVGIGVATVCFVAALFLVKIFGGRPDTAPGPRYVMTRDGSVYRIVPAAGNTAEVEDLEGKPVIDSKTGKRLEAHEIDRRASANVPSYPEALRGREDRVGYSRSEHYFLLWRGSRQTLWYYSRRYGQLVAYDVRTRQRNGFLGPEGFSPSLSGSSERFLYPKNPSAWSSVSGPFLCTSNTVYRPDLQHLAVTPVFKVPEGDRILALDDLGTPNSERACSVIVSRRALHLLSPQGKLLCETPTEPGSLQRGLFQLSALEPAGQFAFWIFPSAWANRKADWKYPIRIVWFSQNEGVLKTGEVPALRASEPTTEVRDRILFAAAPPVFFVVLPFLSGEDWRGAMRMAWERAWFSTSLAAALVTLPIGWWMGARHRLRPAALLGWTLFNLLFGVAGLLTFLCVREWPAEEVCSKCRKLRSVAREECEHCGAAFAPAEKNGTEIFEPLAAG